MDYFPIVIASAVGAIVVELVNKNDKKNSQLINNLDNLDNLDYFEFEEAEILTNQKIEEYTKINLSKK